MRRRHNTGLGSINPPTIAGFAIVGVITIACLSMALFLRHGLPVGTESSARMVFLLAHPLAWKMGWVGWMLSALGLLLFCCLLLEYIPASPWRSYGIALVAVGIAPDISAELIYAVVLPRLAEHGAVEAFELLEFIATQLTGVLGNGAYCLGGLTLNLLMLRNRLLSRALVWAGMPAWLLGLGLSVAVLGSWMTAAAVLTAASMTWSLTWMFLVTLRVFRFPARYRAEAA